MVPYVRKSFRKHFFDGLEFLYEPNEYEIKTEDLTIALSIESDDYKYF